MGKCSKSGKKIVNLPFFENNDVIVNFCKEDSDMQACLERVSSILNNEGYSGKQLFVNQKALNLDKVERLKSVYNQDNTVDFVVGCKNGILLLCEAKFKIRSVDNILSNLKQKIDHSLRLLSSNINFVSCCRISLLLLPDRRFYENERRLMNLVNNNPKIKPMRVVDFYSNCFI